ncbi:MAG: hypothetical protein VB009_04650 [Erysipelotrichaceae bacterium]|nr:hypothetical protein [Erysipelotrichaceae bacterium]
MKTFNDKKRKIESVIRSKKKIFFLLVVAFMLINRESFAFKVGITETSYISNNFFMSSAIEIDRHSSMKVFEYEQKSQYPLTLIGMNQVYFINEYPYSNSDQIYTFHHESNRINSLTNEFFAINYIYELDETKLIIVGVKLKERNICVYSFNLLDNSIKKLFTDIDFNCVSAYYNPIIGCLYFIGNSYANYEDVRNRFNEANFAIGEDYNILSEDTYIYKYDNDSLKFVCKTDNLSLANFWVDFDGILYIEGYQIKFNNNSLVKYKIVNDKIEEGFQSVNISDYIMSSIYFVDNNRMVFLGVNTQAKPSLNKVYICLIITQRKLRNYI